MMAVTVIFDEIPPSAVFEHIDPYAPGLEVHGLALLRSPQKQTGRKKKDGQMFFHVPHSFDNGLSCCFAVLGIAKIFPDQVKEDFVFPGKDRVAFFDIAKRKAFSATVYGDVPYGILPERIIHQTDAEAADVRVQQHLDDLVVAVGGEKAFEVGCLGHADADPVQMMLYGEEVIDRLDEAVVIKIRETDAFAVIQGIFGTDIDAGLVLRDLDELDVLVGKDMGEAFLLVPGKVDDADIGNAGMDIVHDILHRPFQK